MKKQPKFVRWYDRYDNICALVNLTQNLPLTVQENVGNHLLALIGLYQESLGWDKDLRSLGSYAVLSLYKSKRKLRWYDKIPSLHKAFSYLAVFPESVLHECDARFEPLVEYLEKNKKSYVTADMAETIYSFINPQHMVTYQFREDMPI